MEEWNIIKAYDYCYNVTDGTHDSPKQTEFGKYLITSKHIKDNRIDFESAYKISEDDYNKIITRSKVDQWDIIISMIGAYCGFCCIESSKQTDYAIKNVGLLKVGNELKCKWLYYYLTSPHGKQQLSKLRSGSSQPYISFMEQWEEYKIEDICEQIFAGGDAAKYNSSKHQTALYNIPIYANSTEKEGLYGYCDKAIVLSPAVTIAARGAGIGFVAFRNKPFVPIVRLITLITNNSVDTKFLYYYLKNRRLSGDGSAIPQITVPMVKKEVVTIPALEEQKRIADILSSFDAKIELNRRINDNLKATAA